MTPAGPGSEVTATGRHVRSLPEPRRVVVAALGSEYRRDDGAGAAVAKAAAAAAGHGAEIGPLGEPIDLLGRWDGAELAVVVDAVSSGEPAGTVRVVELGADLPAGTVDAPSSSHGIGLVGALRLARAVGSAPGRVVAVTIEGADFSAGIGLSPDVAAAVPIAVAAVLGVLGGGSDAAREDPAR